VDLVPHYCLRGPKDKYSNNCSALKTYYKLLSQIIVTLYEREGVSTFYLNCIQYFSNQYVVLNIVTISKQSVVPSLHKNSSVNTL